MKQRYAVEDIMNILSKQSSFEAKVINENKKVVILEFDTIIFDYSINSEFGKQICVGFNDFGYMTNITPIKNIIKIIED